MLVVISGVESIHKRLIARQVIARMNEFVVDGWKLDLSMDNPFGIIGPDGEYIDIQKFVSETEDYSQESYDARAATLKRMIEVEEKVFQTYGTENHYHQKFCSPEYDRGFSKVIVYEDPNDTIGWPGIGSYEDLLTNYNESDLEYFPITGIFGQCFIEKLRADVGAENVLVINIIRNPSVVFTLHNKIPDFTPNQTYTEAGEQDKLYKSLYNAAILKDDPSVTTVRFEDMIASGEFFVNGVDVGLYIDYNSDDGLLTAYERENILPRLEVTDQMVEDFNQTIQPCLLRMLNSPKEGGAYNAETFDTNPWNLFEKLGYEPLTFTQIRNS